MTYAARLARLERNAIDVVDDLPIITPDMTPKEAAAIYAQQIRKHSSQLRGRETEIMGITLERAAQLFRRELG